MSKINNEATRVIMCCPIIHDFIDRTSTDELDTACLTTVQAPIFVIPQ